MDPIDTLTTKYPTSVFLVGYLASRAYRGDLTAAAGDIAWLRERGYDAEADMLADAVARDAVSRAVAVTR